MLSQFTFFRSGRQSDFLETLCYRNFEPLLSAPRPLPYRQVTHFGMPWFYLRQLLRINPLRRLRCHHKASLLGLPFGIMFISLI